MSHLPIHLEISHRRYLVAGGGQVALRRINTLLDHGADVVVVAPNAEPELADLARAGKIDWVQKSYDKGCLEGVSLVVAATDDRMVNEQVAADAKSLNLWMCRADSGEAGDFIFPAVVQRGDLVLSIATGGCSPSLAAVLRDRLAEEFDPDWAALVDLFRTLRDEFKGSRGSIELRKEAVRRILDDHLIRQFLHDGMKQEAEARARECLSSVLE